MDARAFTNLTVATLYPHGFHISSSQSLPTLLLGKAVHDTPTLNSQVSDRPGFLNPAKSLQNLVVHKSHAPESSCRRCYLIPTISCSPSWHLNEDQLLVYCAPEDFLPCLASAPTQTKEKDTTPALNPPAPNNKYKRLPFRALVTFISPSVARRSGLPGSFRFSRITASLSRFSGNLAASVVAKYRKEYPNDYEDEGPDEIFQWEEEMIRFEEKVRYFEG
ncbi:hypothetical protein GALMADRAFT_137729 [Galerina marginata CBS 339.88]|uniref:Uncharacterized protein n=1 Tax=Galerina marginata (strain CBS 339.88) TaxID=685588 RepID=A0A067TIA5_GALM3|nr:hypothetical protein GALMADRAFT_137729 [Galerina marginata CBS 339.88]